MSEANRLLELTGDKFEEKIDSVVSKDGTLRVGIVGQVKAGKSSFINALLFDGKDILPKAATPMTAALSVVKYSEKLYAEVEFYSEADWSIINRQVEEYKRKYKEIESELKRGKRLFETISKIEIENRTKDRVGVSISSSYEIYMMVQNSGLKIDKYIGKIEKISNNITSISQLIGELKEYVGAGGKYTPLTKNTNIYLNIPTLKGIEIIDTPGTNDPIVSRGQTTRDFLSRCDSVFLLSSSGQFMGKEDTEFLVNTLPSEGISSIVLLGSKFDSVLVDEFRRYKGDIKYALKDLYQKLSYQADNSLSKIIEDNLHKPIMDRIKDRKVRFISAISYNIAKKNRKNLDDMEHLTLSNLQKRYNFEFTDDILFQLANIDTIRDKELKEIKDNKKDILDRKLDDFISGQKEQVLVALGELKVDILQHLEEVKNSNIEELSQKSKLLEEGFERAKDGIAQIFIDFEFDIKEKLYKLISEINNSKSDYLGVSRSKNSRD
jgi:predicted GTPase